MCEINSWKVDEKISVKSSSWKSGWNKMYMDKEIQLGKLGRKILHWKIDGKTGVKSSNLENGWKIMGIIKKILTGKPGWNSLR